MNLNDMITKKKQYGYSCEYIAGQSDIPLSTVQKIFSGITSAPRRKTLEALSAFFRRAEVQDRNYRPSGEDDMVISCVREDPDYGTVDGTSARKPEYTGENNKTIMDYLNLPEGERVELIDGTFYDMAAPTFSHQEIGLSICFAFRNFVEANGGECIPAVAPVDVQLDCDDKTMVQPDVMIICDRNKITKPRIVGAPDLIVEVLSPSNWYHDLVRKLRKYKKAGVREYWIVIPDSLKVLVYYFEKSDIPEEYSFNDEVPVNIWDGRCKVDFRKIYERVSFIL